MLVKKETENWLRIAESDLKAAEALIKSGLHLQCVEHCHAALEKLLKGMIKEQKDIQPPKVHSLLKLISLTIIQDLEDDIKKLLRTLDASYISMRYPEDIERFNLQFSTTETEKILNRVKELFKWLKKQITN